MKSLYTNIRNEEGITACINQFTKDNNTLEDINLMQHNAGNAVSETQNSKISGGACPRSPGPLQLCRHYGLPLNKILATLLMLPFTLTLEKQVSYTVKALRYRRLITNNDTVHKHLDNLRIILITRGYSQHTIHTAFQKALQFTQHDLIHKHSNTNNTTNTNNTNDPPPLTFCIPFNSNTTHIGSILRKH